MGISRSLVTRGVLPQAELVASGQSEEEQLFTSPLRLLLVIDGELSARPGDGAAQMRGAAGTQGMLDAGAAMPAAERRRRLLELRADVQRCWEADAARTGS